MEKLVAERDTLRKQLGRAKSAATRANKELEAAHKEKTAVATPAEDNAGLMAALAAAAEMGQELNTARVEAQLCGEEAMRLQTELEKEKTKQKERAVRASKPDLGRGAGRANAAGQLELKEAHAATRAAAARAKAAVAALRDEKARSAAFEAELAQARTEVARACESARRRTAEAEARATEAAEARALEARAHTELVQVQHRQASEKRHVTAQQLQQDMPQPRTADRTKRTSPRGRTATNCNTAGAARDGFTSQVLRDLQHRRAARQDWRPTPAPRSAAAGHTKREESLEDFVNATRKLASALATPAPRR